MITVSIENFFLITLSYIYIYIYLLSSRPSKDLILPPGQIFLRFSFAFRFRVRRQRGRVMALKTLGGELLSAIFPL